MSDTFKDYPYWYMLNNSNKPKSIEFHNHGNNFAMKKVKRVDNNGNFVTVMRRGFLFSDLKKQFRFFNKGMLNVSPHMGDLHFSTTVENDEGFFYTENNAKIYIKQFKNFTVGYLTKELDSKFLSEQEVYVYDLEYKELTDEEFCTIDEPLGSYNGSPNNCYRYLGSRNELRYYRDSRKMKQRSNKHRRTKERSSLHGYIKAVNSNDLEDVDLNDIVDNANSWY